MLAHPLLRLSLGLTALGGLTACPAEAPTPVPQPPYAPPPAQAPVVVFPEVMSELMVVNGSDFPQLFRVRSPMAGVQIDCEAVAIDPARRLAPELFGPASTWLLEPGRAMGLRPDMGGSCAALWIDGPALEPRLVFYRPEGYPALYQSTEGRGVATDRALTVLGAPEAMHWSEHPALLRPVAPEAAGLECETRLPGTGIDWSTPPLGLVGLQGMRLGADGCYALDLEVGEAPFRWFVCAPDAEFPFEINDDLTIGLVHGGSAGRPVDGLTIEGPGGRVTLVRGGDLPVPYAVAAVEGCGGHVDSCGSFVQAARAQVQGQWAEAGTAVHVSDVSTLHLYRAETALALNPACLPHARIGQPTFEAALVDRFVQDVEIMDEMAEEEEAPPGTDAGSDDPPAEGDAGGANPLP